MKDLMKMKNIYIRLFVVVLAAFSLSSCSDFLSKESNGSTTIIDTPEKAKLLLVNAYPSANIASLGELSSDNFLDNNSSEDVGFQVQSPLTAYDKMDDEIFAWEPVTSSTEQDSPYYLWESCYNAIATANHVLEAIDLMEKNGETTSMAAERGEALLCRAYSHFLLVNIFAHAYKDSIASLADPGIPYITKSENIVYDHHDRGSVTEDYVKIKADILNGLECFEAAPNLTFGDKNKAEPYHFNKKAAYAFAARFFLFKREYTRVVDYATRVLGSNPSGALRNWSALENLPSDVEKIGYAYINSQEPANLMLLSTTSWQSRRIAGYRYGHNASALRGGYRGNGPSWTNYLPCFQYLGFWYRKSSDYGYFSGKCNEFFEYTDKVAQIGTGHIIRTEFTADETLLCRAEAYIHLNNMSEALNDLKAWSISHLASRALTEKSIKDFYIVSNTDVVKPLHATEMSSEFAISEEQEPYIQCVLHFRRLETLFDGNRWFDIKRYGIEIDRHVGKTRNILTWNDPRRAIQIPVDIIAAGMKPNDRLTLPSDNSNLHCDKSFLNKDN